MDSKLKEYYDKRASEFGKSLIDCCCVLNSECPANNHYGNRTSKKMYMKPITDDDIDQLDLNIKKYDGTLLVDIVSKFMREHKIFY